MSEKQIAWEEYMALYRANNGYRTDEVNAAQDRWLAARGTPRRPVPVLAVPTWDARGDLPPLVVITNLGTHAVQPVVQTAQLALHPMIGTDDHWTITHRATGWGIVSLRGPRATAEQALRELAQFDWTGAAPDQLIYPNDFGGAGAALEKMHARYWTTEREARLQLRGRDAGQPRSAGGRRRIAELLLRESTP